MNDLLKKKIHCIVFSDEYIFMYLRGPLRLAKLQRDGTIEEGGNLFIKTRFWQEVNQSDCQLIQQFL